MNFHRKEVPKSCSTSVIVTGIFSPVDDPLVLDESKNPRLVISRLTFRRDRTDLNREGEVLESRCVYVYQVKY